MIESGRTVNEASYSAEYAGTLADHLPMALSALRRLGASDSRRSEFSATYIAAKRLRPLDVDDPEYRARDVMHRRLVRDRAAVLRDELRTLACGVGAGAFHALIRVAYGIVDDDDAEIAAGLVYWRGASFDLGDVSSSAARTPFVARAALEEARAALLHVPRTLDPRGFIAARMRAVATDAAFAGAAGNPYLESDALAQLAALTVRVFAVLPDFTILHAMTATHAMRIVLPFAPDGGTALLSAYWRAYLAAFISAGAPALPDDSHARASKEPLPSWKQLHLLACASDDEHHIKATYTAWIEDRFYQDDRYRLAIARYLARA